MLRNDFRFLWVSHVLLLLPSLCIFAGEYRAGEVVSVEGQVSTVRFSRSVADIVLASRVTLYRVSMGKLEETGYALVQKPSGSSMTVRSTDPPQLGDIAVYGDQDAFKKDKLASLSRSSPHVLRSWKTVTGKSFRAKFKSIDAQYLIVEKIVDDSFNEFRITFASISRTDQEWLLARLPAHQRTPLAKVSERAIPKPPVKKPGSPTYFYNPVGRGISGTVIRSSGFTLDGYIYHMTPTTVSIRVAGKRLKFHGSGVREVRVAGDRFTFNAAKQTFESDRTRALAGAPGRSGRIKVVNASRKEIRFAMTKYTAASGEDIRFSKPLVWTFEPGEKGYLLRNKMIMVATKAHFTVTTNDGSMHWYSTKKWDERDLEITIGTPHLLTPVLVEVGSWNWQQGVRYTTNRSRTPTTIVPVKGWFSGKIDYYEVYGGDEVEYTVENLDRYASATATIENPSTKTIRVDATIEFQFKHLVLSRERVKASITVKPKSKTKIAVNVDTKGFFDNRKLQGVKQIDITTTVK